MRLVNGFTCRNCGDEELAKHGIDPAHPRQGFSGNEAYVPPPSADDSKLGVNQPSTTGKLGRRLDLRA